jgi:hypothetical protein
VELPRGDCVLICDQDLTLVPQRNYGLRPNARFCPVRDYGIPQFTNNPTFLHLYLLQAEITIGAPASAVYARRAIIYAGVKERVENPEASQQDTTLVLLGGWGVTESRFGFPDLARQHWRAVLRLCRLRGGLKVLHEMSAARGMGLMLCLLHPYMPYFETCEALLEALERFTLPKGRAIDKRLHKYFDAESQQRGHLWNLYMMNQVMEQDPDPAFESELLSLVLASGPGMLASAMQFVIPTVVAKFGRWKHEKPLVRAWEVVEFVSLMHLCPAPEKMVIQKALSGWLCGTPHAELDLDMVRIKQSILDEWDRNQLAAIRH